MANEGADNERIREALDAALDELDSDNEEGIDERPNKSEQRSATTANIVDPIDPSSPEALLESFIGQMMVNGNEDELLDKVMGEMEAHIHSAVSQQEELSAEIPPATSQPSAAMSANPTNASDSFLRQPQSSSKRKHSCEPPPSLDAVIGNLFEEIASENEKLDRAAAMEGSTFRPPGISEDDPIMQNLMKELEGLKTNDLDTDSVIDGMMEQLLSKDLMYQPMKQVAGRFPSWLDANKSKLSESEYIEYVTS